MADDDAALRALRVIADAAGRSRPRTAADFSDPDVPVAATVVLLREGDAGPEVLMIRRPDRGSFGGAWVFPGGRLDAADGDPAIEEAAARAAALRETREETGLELDAGGLVPLSCWDPPPGIALRIRTWFFLGSDPGGELAPEPQEVDAVEWTRPADVLARHARGELTLYPPTFVTLDDLAGHADVQAILETARISGLKRYATVAREGAGGPMLLWQGDADYEDDRSSAVGAASRHRLDLSRLPWVYTRTP
ncbi:NUDIX hydrolase [Microbacterium lacus]|uniref:Nudix hydrolase domain-containing protein n=1 Tax=Microbacterium lacus TaxID=415217 RepID=A0ABP4SAR6_9MICO